MKRTLLNVNLSEFPEQIKKYFIDCDVYDSSCSPQARVWFADKDGGYFIKSADPKTLEKEAKMTGYFNKKGLATEVLDYFEAQKDWLVTKAVKGEDCTYQKYLDDPKRLCKILGETLRYLHSLDHVDCPRPDRMGEYIKTVCENYEKGVFDPLCFTQAASKMSRDEAFRYFYDNRSELVPNTLIHGDYCLPNVMLDDWKFSAFIDLDNGGVADSHIDLFWGIWTLKFNLKTDKYTNYLIDAYGRELVNIDKLTMIECAEAFG